MKASTALVCGYFIGWLVGLPNSLVREGHSGWWYLIILPLAVIYWRLYFRAKSDEEAVS